jgi:putrescine transport system ATP-binding protein
MPIVPGPASAPASERPPAAAASAGAAAYVRLAGLTKRFGSVTAVSAVSLDIKKGEIFCLLGASGCGKTTLLRMLAGFESPSEGRIWIDGIDVTDVPPYERPVNLMFQSYALFPHLTVEGNVAFGLKQDGLARAELRERVAAMLQLVQLNGLAKRKPHQLSGGQRQRVALARALVKRPKLLLLDEPLGALDRKLRERTQFELLSLQDRLGVTFVIVTHDQEEAMTLGTRIGVMESGEIVQVGSPTDVYEYPTSRFVADFIGSVNLFEGKLVEDEPDHVRIHCAELGATTVFVDHGISSAPSAEVCVALRPEKITLSREPPAAGEAQNCATGTVAEIAYLGEVSRYLVRLAGGRIVRVSQPNLQRHAERIAWDEGVFLSWSASAPVVLTK